MKKTNGNIKYLFLLSNINSPLNYLTYFSNKHS